MTTRISLRHVQCRTRTPLVRLPLTLMSHQRRNIATRDMTGQDFEKLKVEKSRLMESIHHTCSWGTGLRWGRQVLIYVE